VSGRAWADCRLPGALRPTAHIVAASEIDYTARSFSEPTYVYSSRNKGLSITAAIVSTIL
jgi:hypothetical protein